MSNLGSSSVISRPTVTSREIYYSVIVNWAIMPLVVIKPICTSNLMHQNCKVHFFGTV